MRIITVVITIANFSITLGIIHEAWVFVSLNLAALQASSIPSIRHATSSMTHCLGIATSLVPAWVLACYDAGECSLWALQSLGTAVRDDTLGNTVCKTTTRKLGKCLLNVVSAVITELTV